VAEREASGEFDYLIGDLTEPRQETDWSDGGDAWPDEATQHEFDQQWADGPAPAPHPQDGSFDAFDENTWYFEPAPAPWYRTKQSLTALLATAAASIALVVCGVLLVFRGGPAPAVDESTSVTPTAPTTVASAAPSTSPQPPAPPPPPPAPTETSAERVVPPAPTYQPPSTRAKPPEIGVTRTPVTRMPLSVSPQRPGVRR
jgi:hypothetical protein